MISRSLSDGVLGPMQVSLTRKEAAREIERRVRQIIIDRR
jgi:hypothetical protein